MNEDEIREHIESAGGREPSETRRLATRMLGGCWPGGAADRTEPAALQWVRQWWPERLGATLPRCSCASGHCVVCN